MNVFFQWEGWIAVSSICQVLIALFALIAICITINQISSKTNGKVDMSLTFGLGIIEYDKERKIIPGFSIHLANLGMASLYISECGIEFFHGKTSKSGLILTNTPFVLRPGECVIKNMERLEFFIAVFDNEVSLHDKIKIYVIDGIGKKYYKKTKYDYAELKSEFEKYAECAKESNSGILNGTGDKSKA